MSIDVTPHLNFRGTARAALEHYRDVFGGELTVATYGDLGAAASPEEAGQVVFGQVVAPDGFRIMAYDVPAAQPWDAGQAPFFVSVRSVDAEGIARRWERLAEGATVLQPLGPSGWAPLYGMLRDPFGITWVLDVTAEQPAALEPSGDQGS